MRVSNRCRICLSELPLNKKMQPLFDNRNRHCAEIVRRIEECGGIKLKPLKQYPKVICDDCVRLLDTSYKFRSLCQESESALLNGIIKTQPKAKLNELVSQAIEQSNETSQIEYPEFINTSQINFEDIASNNKSNNHDVNVESLDNDVSAVEENDADYVIDELNDNGDELIDKIESISDSDEEFIKIFPKRTRARNAKVKPKAQLKSKFKQTLGNKLQRKRGRPPLKVNTQENNDENPLKSLGKRGRKKLKEEAASIICEICGNIYSKRSLLKLHMRRHTAEKPFDCEICGKSFACPSEIARHIRTHTGEKPYVCKFCGRRFSDRSTNIKHERIHTNERPFQCEACGKSFTYSNVLKNHMLTHTGEKPFVCSPCNKTFSRKHQLDQHLSTITHYQTVKHLSMTDADVKPVMPNLQTICINSYYKTENVHPTPPPQTQIHIQLQKIEQAPVEATLAI